MDTSKGCVDNPTGDRCFCKSDGKVFSKRVVGDRPIKLAQDEFGSGEFGYARVRAICD